MPNYLPKGREYMRDLGRRGGTKSGETRRINAVVPCLPGFENLGRIIAAVADLNRPNHSGGSRDTDWRCPYCRRFNSIKKRLCAGCFRSPRNGRLTRGALRERAQEHRLQAILRKHGLTNTQALELEC